MKNFKKCWRWLVVVFILVIFLWPKYAGQTGTALPSPEDGSWLNTECKCAGYKVNTTRHTDSPNEFSCFGIPFSCKVTLHNEYVEENNDPLETQSPAENIKSEISEKTMAEKVLETINSGKALNEIENPGFVFPEDIDNQQANKFFQLGNYSFALIVQPSMNIPLSLTYTPSFVGGLIAEDGDDTWSKFFEITDSDTSDKNNPYFLWIENEQLTLSVVDQKGAGSGEGVEKVFALQLDGTWELDGCYYFGSNFNSGDYFEHSSNLEAQNSQPLSSCNNMALN